MINKFLDKLDGIIESGSRSAEFGDNVMELASEFEVAISNIARELFDNSVKDKDAFLIGLSSSDRRKLITQAISKIKSTNVY